MFIIIIMSVTSVFAETHCSFSSSVVVCLKKKSISDISSVLLTQGSFSTSDHSVWTPSKIHCSPLKSNSLSTNPRLNRNVSLFPDSYALYLNKFSSLNLTPDNAKPRLSLTIFSHSPSDNSFPRSPKMKSRSLHHKNRSLAASPWR